MTEPSLLYAYAVTRKVDCRLPESLRGVGDVPVHLVADGDLAAVVSPVPAADFEEAPLRAHLEDMQWLERTARDHQQVVDAVAATACALPMRMATVYRGEHGVRRMLAEDRERWESALAMLDGRDEWGVKMYASAEGSAGPAPETVSAAADAGDSRRPVSGRDYLRRRQEARQAREESRQHAEGWARQAHEELAKLAEHTRLHRPQDARLSGAKGENLLNGAYLVPRSEAGAFTALVGELADRAARLRIELTGPWAPYSFTSLTTGTGGEVPR